MSYRDECSREFEPVLGQIVRYFDTKGVSMIQQTNAAADGKDRKLFQRKLFRRSGSGLRTRSGGAVKIVRYSDKLCKMFRRFDSPQPATVSLHSPIEQMNTNFRKLRPAIAGYTKEVAEIRQGNVSRALDRRI
jgi:hypothetical protein